MSHSKKLIVLVALALFSVHVSLAKGSFSDERVPQSTLERDRMAKAEASFNAGKFQKAEKLFRAELAMPESPHIDCKTGHTPKSFRLRIWVARCQGRLGKSQTAFRECLQLTQETENKRDFWGKQDTERLAKTLVENARTPAQTTQVQKIAQAQQFKELQEYFAALSLVEKQDAAAVVKYITRNHVHVSPIDPPIWRDEIMAKAGAIKDEMVAYTIDQIEKRAQTGGSDLNMHHLHHLFEVMSDERFVVPCLGSPRLERNYPDPYRDWLKIFRVYPQACKRTALQVLNGDRRNREHGLDLINSLQLYDRETLDAVAVVAGQEYYPTQVRSLLAFWRVSGHVFGLEAETPKLALKQANDDERRAALAQAVEWWKRQRQGLDPGTPVTPRTADRDVLKRGQRCTIEMIRRDAEAELRQCAQSIQETPNALVVTGYSSEGKRVTLLKAGKPVATIPFPNAADRKYAKQLPENIKSKVTAFIGDDQAVLTVEAARVYGRILLLDVSERGVDDGNLHIVYDLKRNVVVGYFLWYMQG